MGLSADHGALLAPETLPQPGESSVGRRATREERAALGAVARDAAVMQNAGDTAVATKTAAALARLPFVAAVYTHAQLLNNPPADSFAVLARRSLYPGRAASTFSRFGVEVRFEDGWMARSTGTTHGMPYWYNRHVPLLFMGPGIAAGRDTTRAATVDFAPTLARLVGLTPPPGLDGRALVGVVGP